MKLDVMTFLSEARLANSNVIGEKLSNVNQDLNISIKNYDIVGDWYYYSNDFFELQVLNGIVLGVMLDLSSDKLIFGDLDLNKNTKLTCFINEFEKLKIEWSFRSKLTFKKQLTIRTLADVDCVFAHDNSKFSLMKIGKIVL